jgi:hypothetical protein
MLPDTPERNAQHEAQAVRYAAEQAARVARAAEAAAKIEAVAPDKRLALQKIAREGGAQTTNLGAGSSNLSGRASSSLKLECNLQRFKTPM